jgi:hypothetical protein
VRFIGGVALCAGALLVSACSTTTAVPRPTVTVTASALPEVRGPGSRIDALDAYALCSARIYRPPLEGRYSVSTTPFESATIKRTDSFGWYVLLKRTDSSPGAVEYGLPTEAWGRCALDGTFDDVTWTAHAYCSGPEPVDDLSDLAAIGTFDPSNPHAPLCPTGD